MTYSLLSIFIAFPLYLFYKILLDILSYLYFYIHFLLLYLVFDQGWLQKGLFLHL